ncbi:MAG: hypothetical protein GX327_00005 [Epulopiscium sp.]|nr:hypothetical protein [Candidatus Epulonipiscium sp.]
MKEKFGLIKGYQNNNSLRKSFNSLAQSIFGFKKSKEYMHYKNINNNTEKIVERFLLTGAEDRKKLESAIRNSSVQSYLWLKNNLELSMFYITKFMNNDVYFIKSQNTYVIAEQNNEILYLYQVFAPNKVNLDEIIVAFGKSIKKVVLGFTPLFKEGYESEEINDEDTTLFIKGEAIELFERNNLRIPILART